MLSLKPTCSGLFEHKSLLVHIIASYATVNYTIILTTKLTDITIRVILVSRNHANTRSQSKIPMSFNCVDFVLNNLAVWSQLIGHDSLFQRNNPISLRPSFIHPCTKCGTGIGVFVKEWLASDLITPREAALAIGYN